MLVELTGATNILPTADPTVQRMNRQRGYHLYELGNFKEDVQVVVSDIKVRVCAGCSTIIAATHYEADVKQAIDQYPFGWEMPGRTFLGSNNYRYTVNGMEKSPEIASGHNSSYFRELDARTGRWWSTDPVWQPWQSPYCTFDNNPVALSDPSGAATGNGAGTGIGCGKGYRPPTTSNATKSTALIRDWIKGMAEADHDIEDWKSGWVRTDKAVIYDSRVTNQEEAKALYGDGAENFPIGHKYKSKEGNEIELGDYGFFKLNGEVTSTKDLAEESLEYTDPEKIMNEEIAEVESRYIYSAMTLAFISTDAVVPEPSDLAPPKWMVYRVASAVSAYYVNKMLEEIKRIRRKHSNRTGVQYALIATTSKNYPCYLCVGGTMNLNVGDVWKYGETILSPPESRYGRNWLTSNNLRMDKQFYGNRVQIKVMEKTKIYRYFLTNAHLPPRNKIFR